MNPLFLLSLLGVALLVPLFDGDDGETESEPQDNAQDPVEPVEPVEPPVDPVAIPTAEDEDTAIPATATLDEARNTVTVTTDPDETGTLHLIANRVDIVDSDGQSDFVYEASVWLFPEGFDLVEDLANTDPDDVGFFIPTLTDAGGTALGTWEYDPTAAAGSSEGLPDFEYPQDIAAEFVRIETVNFGDGGQIDGVADAVVEAGLAAPFDTAADDISFQLLEDRGGTLVTAPGDFEGSLIALETTTDYFFEDQLVRTEVFVELLTLNEGADFVQGVLSLADQTTQTTTQDGTLYEIADGSLTSTELLEGVPATEEGGGIGVSAIEYDEDGNITRTTETAGLGVSANVDVIRYEVSATGDAVPADRQETTDMWQTDMLERTITSFIEVDNIAATMPAA